jgi:hypothetical protein
MRIARLSACGSVCLATATLQACAGQGVVGASQEAGSETEAGTNATMSPDATGATSGGPDGSANPSATSGAGATSGTSATPSRDGSASSGNSASGGSGSTSGGNASGSSSSTTSSGSSQDGGQASGDVSVPAGVPSAGTCAKIPVINGGQLVAALLARASPSKCTGANIVSSHAYAKEGGGGGTANICKLAGAVYYASGMNIDCDGLADSCMPQHCPSDDPTNQKQTSFTDAKGQFLSAGLTPYVVIPSDFTYPGLDTSNGGNVVAVIYQNQLEFAVFGDTGPNTIVGEASYATANNLGISPDPATGGTSGPVTYIVFTGTGTAPQDLSNPQQTWQLGMMLAQQLVANNP